MLFGIDFKHHFVNTSEVILQQTRKRFLYFLIYHLKKYTYFISILQRQQNRADCFLFRKTKMVDPSYNILTVSRFPHHS